MYMSVCASIPRWTESNRTTIHSNPLCCQVLEAWRKWLLKTRRLKTPATADKYITHLEELVLQVRATPSTCMITTAQCVSLLSALKIDTPPSFPSLNFT